MIAEDNRSLRLNTETRPYACSHCEKCFPTKGNLKRHELAHRPPLYYCPVDDCKCSGFSREDKLMDHLRRSLHPENAPTTCPVPRCPFKSRFDLLILHVAHHSEFEAPSVYLLQYFGWKREQCPLSGCRRWIKVDTMIGPHGHLMRQHTDEERHNENVVLCESGYTVDGNPIHPGDRKLSCPICKQTLTGTANFEVHLENEHILTEAGKAHASPIRPPHYPNSWCFWYDHWYMKEYRHWRETLPSVHREGVSHANPLLNVMKPTEELYRHRLEILRLWPVFACHPVFDDVRLVEYDTQPENTPSTSTISTDTAGTETADAPRKVNGRNRKKRNSDSSGPARKEERTTSSKRAKSSGHQHD